MKNPCSYLDDVRHLAIEAGRRILDVYERVFSVEHKADGSPLTEADGAAQAVIARGLEALAPDLPIISEESASVAHTTRAEWSRFWLIDPLDGTREFVSRNGEFTVNIALIEAERPVLGVVHVPVTGQTYFACRGQGAFRQRPGEQARPIRARSFQGGRPTVVASRSHAGERLAEFLARLGEHEVVSMGSALKLCLVAEGTADVYPRLGPTSEWDTAAAQCVVEEAGGRVVDLDNKPLRYNKPSVLNPWFVVCGRGGYDWTALLPRPV